MTVVIEVAVDDYYCLRARCRRSSPEYSILEKAVFRANAFGISGDRFVILCNLTEAENLLDLAKHLSLNSVHDMEQAINRARQS